MKTKSPSYRNEAKLRHFQCPFSPSLALQNFENLRGIHSKLLWWFGYLLDHPSLPSTLVLRRIRLRQFVWRYFWKSSEWISFGWLTGSCLAFSSRASLVPSVARILFRGYRCRGKPLMWVMTWPPWTGRCESSSPWLCTPWNFCYLWRLSSFVLFFCTIQSPPSLGSNFLWHYYG